TSAIDAEMNVVRDRFPLASVVMLTEKPCRMDRVAQRILRLAGLPDRLPAMPDLVTHAMAFMAALYRQRRTVGDVARSVGLSEDRLAHVFKKATGYAVREYLMRLRMAVARRLLTDSNAKLETVASRVGLADASALSKTFLDLTGVRPGEFRRSSQGGG